MLFCISSLFCMAYKRNSYLLANCSITQRTNSYQINPKNCWIMYGSSCLTPPFGAFFPGPCCTWRVGLAVEFSGPSCIKLMVFIDNFSFLCVTDISLLLERPNILLHCAFNVTKIWLTGYGPVNGLGHSEVGSGLHETRGPLIE